MTRFDDVARTWDENPQAVKRAQAVAAGIRSGVALNPSMTALEYGCGTGLLTFELKERIGPVVLADTSNGMLEVTAEKIEAAGAGDMKVRNLDLTQDPLPAERFDLIYTMMTLHHIENLSPVLEKFHALLNSEGHLCIADLDAEDGSFHGPDMDVHHGFDRTSFATELLQAGFASVQLQDVFEMQRNDRTYPVFLAIAQRA